MRKVNKMAKKRYNSKPLPKVEKGKIHIVNMSSYTRPEIKEQYNRDWVEYGDDNNYFSYLISEILFWIYCYIDKKKFTVFASVFEYIF